MELPIRYTAVEEDPLVGLESTFFLDLGLGSVFITSSGIIFFILVLFGPILNKMLSFRFLTDIYINFNQYLS